MFQSRNLPLSKIIIFGMLIAFISCTPGKQKIPKIVGNTIYFLDGKTQIEMGEMDTFHIFAEQDRVVYISKQIIKNHVGEFTISFFDFMGEAIAQSIIYPEFHFVFAETTGRILAGAVLAWPTSKSYLYDLDGNLLNVLTNEAETKDVGITDDEKYFWFASNKMRPLLPGEEPFPPLPDLTYRPYNHIMIFDASTGEFVETFSTDEAHFDFVINGKQYAIVTSPPDLPG